MREAVRRFFEDHGIQPCRILAAVSGGYDSTALLLALNDLQEDGFEIGAAHVNHHLRGAASEGDEHFVRDICEKRGIPLTVLDGSFDREDIRRHGIEGAARERRTALLLEARETTAARYVATAHQKNDQAETVLMRLLTGSGIAGLRGIHPVRDDGFVRPLLGVTRAEIAAFLAARGIAPRHDSMNDDERFTRTRIRKTLAGYGPRAVASLAALADAAREQHAALERTLDAIPVENDRDSVRLVALPDDPYLVRALLHRHIGRFARGARDVSSADLQRLAAALPSLKRTSVTKDVEILREKGVVVIRRRPTPPVPFEYAIAPGEEVAIPEAGVAISLDCLPPDTPISFDSPLVQPFQLPHGADAHFTIRSRRPGDRFRPLGMREAKKLKDFLIDHKLSARDRDCLPLMVSNGSIVWVCGVAVGDDFRINNSGGDRYAARLRSRA